MTNKILYPDSKAILHNQYVLNEDKKNGSKGTDPEIGWVTTAKDYAGELISGQSTSGRILVEYLIIK